MQLQSSLSTDENRSQELQVEVLDEGHFADRFASGTRINSAASNFSPPSNDPSVASGKVHSVRYRLDPKRKFPENKVIKTRFLIIISGKLTFLWLCRPVRREINRCNRAVAEGF